MRINSTGGLVCLDHVTKQSDKETEGSAKLERPGDSEAFRLHLVRLPDEDAFRFSSGGEHGEK